MENPASWSPAEKIVAAAIQEHGSRPEGFCGLSLPATIVQELRKAGLLREDEIDIDTILVLRYLKDANESINFPDEASDLITSAIDLIELRLVRKRG